MTYLHNNQLFAIIDLHEWSHEFSTWLRAIWGNKNDGDVRTLRISFFFIHSFVFAHKLQKVMVESVEKLIYDRKQIDK